MAATPGLRQRHGNRCKRPASGCKCPWEAWVYSAADGKKIRKLFTGKGAAKAAKAWRGDAQGQVRRNVLRAPKPITFNEAADDWMEGAKAGRIRNRKGDVYKPSALRGYDQALRLRLRPKLGSKKLGEITRTDLQDLIDGLLGDGLNASTIVVTMLPARAIYKRACKRPDSGVVVNPTIGLDMPAVRGTRDRIATPEECAKLLAALPERDRALWATAMFGGLRRGELMALHVEDVDFAAGLIHVRRGWDYKVGEIATKSGKDRRVPIPAELRRYLDWHLLRLAWRENPAGLVFGSTATLPFTGTPTANRAKRAWAKAALDPITLHECRHTFASLMIAAGVNAKALSTYMGHATIAITLDRYGHLMPGNEDEAAGLLDAYLARSRASTGAKTGAS